MLQYGTVNGNSSIKRVVQWVVLLSLSAGLAAGVLACRHEIAEFHYLRFGLYRTALRLLVPAMDRYALYAAGLLLAMFAAGRLGRRAKGVPGGVLQVALPLAVLGAAAGAVLHRYPLYSYFIKSSITAILPAAWKFISGPVGLSIVLAFLVVALLRVRAGRRPGLPVPGLRAAGRIAARVVTGLLCLSALAFLGLNLAAGVVWWQTASALRERPNIIFIMVDTLRADHVGCYGYDVPVTPNIDRFAQEAVRFAEPVAQASWTVWSVNSLFTSRFPDQLVPNGMGDRLGPASDLHTYYPTLAKVLKDQGYATHAVISNPLLHRSPGNMMGYDTYDDGPANVDKDCTETSPHVNRAALKLLDGLQGKRFFLSLVYMDPHYPYHNNTGFAYPPSRREPARQALLAKDNTPAKMAERRRRLQAYDSEIGYTDHHIGLLFDELKRRKLYDDSLIVLFSDHGEEFLEHGDFEHMKTVYDEVIRVPLIVKLPRQREGRVVDGRFPLIDLYPSLLAYLRIDARTLGLQGDAAPMAGLLLSADKPIFSSTENIRCVINGEYKYIEYDQPKKRPSELYRLSADPLERHNLAAHKPPPADLVDLLQARDRRQLPSDIALRRVGAASDTPLLSPAEHDRLRSLGYLAK